MNVELISKQTIYAIELHGCEYTATINYDYNSGSTETTIINIETDEAPNEKTTCKIEELIEKMWLT